MAKASHYREKETMGNCESQLYATKTTKTKKRDEGSPVETIDDGNITLKLLPLSALQKSLPIRALSMDAKEVKSVLRPALLPRLIWEIM
jgi:hypothetical protein